MPYCKRCNAELKGKQLSYCSVKCSKLHLKKLYRLRKKEQLKLYNRKYRLSCSFRPLSKSIKVKIWQRDDNQCIRCGSQDNLNVHHIIPLKHKKGNHEYRNLITLCFKCHMLWEKRMKGYWC